MPVMSDDDKEIKRRLDMISEDYILKIGVDMKGREYTYKVPSPKFIEEAKRVIREVKSNAKRKRFAARVAEGCEDEI